MADTTIKEGDKVSWQWGGGKPGGEAVEVATEGEIAIQSKKGNTIKKNASPDNPAVHIGRPGNDVVKRASELDVDKKAGGGGGSDKKEESSGDKTSDKPPEKQPQEKKAPAADKPAGEKLKEKLPAKVLDKVPEKLPEKVAEKLPKTGVTKQAALVKEHVDPDKEPKTGDKRDADAVKDALKETGAAGAAEDKPAAKKAKTDDEANGQKKKPGRPKASGNGGAKPAAKPAAKKREPKKAATETGEPRRSSRHKPS